MSDAARGRLMRAVVKYGVDDDPEAKIRALREGLSEVASELVALGVQLSDVELWMEEAYSTAKYEATYG